MIKYRIRIIIFRKCYFKTITAQVNKIMEEPSNTIQGEDQLQFTKFMKEELRRTANWSMFIAITLIAFFALYLLLILSSLRGLPLASSHADLVLIVLLIFFLIILLGMGILLLNFATHLKKALKEKESNRLVHSLEYLTYYFMAAFIILIIIPVFSLFATILL